MGKFQEKKNEILTASKASKRKTFNEQQFNELGTALLNETGYQSTTYTVKKGELEEITSNPVADLRKPLIGDVLKKAGLDSAEVEKITETHQFPTLPLYPVVSAMIEEYMDAGKVFSFERRKDLSASIYISKEEECVKENRRPGTDEIKKVHQDEYRKVKASSICPDNLKKTL